MYYTLSGNLLRLPISITLYPVHAMQWPDESGTFIKEAGRYGTLWVYPGVREGPESGKTIPGNAGTANELFHLLSKVDDDEKFGDVAVADIVLQDNGVPTGEAQVTLVEKIVQDQFVNNADVSARQIPAWFRFRKSLPPNGK